LVFEVLQLPFQKFLPFFYSHFNLTPATPGNLERSGKLIRVLAIVWIISAVFG